MNREARRNIERVLRSGLSPRKHNPISKEQEAAFTHEMRRQITSLQTDAGLHAWTGEDAQRIQHYIGRLIFMALFATMRWSPHLTGSQEVFGTRYLANAISILQSEPERLEELRPEIQAGMLDLGRLLELLPTIDVAVGSAVHEMQLERMKGAPANDLWMQLHQMGAAA